jgi:uncharacterized protein (TIGR00251 family)
LSQSDSTNRCRLTVRVTPNAGKNSITNPDDDIWKVKIAAPPVEGKANRELIEFLSDKLGIKKSAITIIRGQTGREKVIEVLGMSREDIRKKLSG